MISADLNGDGWADLIVRNAGDGTLSLFLSNGHGGLPAAASILPVGLGASDVTTADLDGNGRLDILVYRPALGRGPASWRTSAEASFSAPVSIAPAPGLTA